MMLRVQAVLRSARAQEVAANCVKRFRAQRPACRRETRKARIARRDECEKSAVPEDVPRGVGQDCAAASMLKGDL